MLNIFMCFTPAKFSENGHVAYQIKADDACSNMVANILPTDTPSTQGWGQKVKPYLFLKVVMLHIKLKQIYCQYFMLKFAEFQFNPCILVRVENSVDPDQMASLTC